MSDFIDLLMAIRVRQGTLDKIPSDQGVYLIFDENDLIYVGKGDLHNRVNIHFNPNAPAGEYFRDAHSWRCFCTGHEDLALACEQAVYDAYVKRVGKPPKHNKRRPEGATNISPLYLQKVGEWVPSGVRGQS